MKYWNFREVTLGGLQNTDRLWLQRSLHEEVHSRIAKLQGANRSSKLVD